jgi:hypothetical protein
MNTLNRFALICLLGALASSPARAVRAQTPVRGVELTSRAAIIVGSVVDGNDKPVPAARLRLRDATSGRIAMPAISDQNGQFRFGGVPRGSYLIECVDSGDDVRGLSQTFSVAPAETLSTIVRLTARRPWYSGFFSNSAVAAVSSAAALGVTAVGNGRQPASGRF